MGEKAEDEVTELTAKARQLETEVDLCTEKLCIVSLQLEEKEKALLAAEAEMNALNRRVSGLEEDLEKTEEKLLQAATRLEMMTKGSPSSRRTSRRPGTRPRLLTSPMMRSTRAWPPATPTWRRPRREPTLASRRSWSSRRS